MFVRRGALGPAPRPPKPPPNPPPGKPPPGNPPNPPRPPPPPRPPGWTVGDRFCVTRRLIASDAECPVVETWKLRVVPGRFGVGMNERSAADVGSIRDAGI